MKKILGLSVFIFVTLVFINHINVTRTVADKAFAQSTNCSGNSRPNGCNCGSNNQCASNNCSNGTCQAVVTTPTNTPSPTPTGTPILCYKIVGNESCMEQTFPQNSCPEGWEPGSCEGPTATPSPTPSVTVTPTLTPTPTNGGGTGGPGDGRGCAVNDCSQQQGSPTQAVLGLSSTGSGANIYLNLAQLISALTLASVGFKLFRKHA